jgi:hypothetical protein
MASGTKTPSGEGDAGQQASERTTWRAAEAEIAVGEIGSGSGLGGEERPGGGGGVVEEDGRTPVTISVW